MSLIPVASMSLAAIPAMTITSCGKDKRIKIIVDTDVGNDCDDIGALSILGNAYKKGLVDIKAVTVCNQYDPAFYTTDIMLEQYGIDCPMGQSDNDQEIHLWHDYAKAIDDKWEARSEKHPERKQKATPVLRQALADAEKGGYKVKLVTLGMFNDIANLFNSPGDSISPKTGKQLFQDNVSEMVSMGGRFNDPTYSEFNIKEALWAAKAVINDEKTVHKTFCGWEAGNLVKTGITFYRHPGSPQCVAYNVYNEGNLRESWDPLTMYYAIFGSPEYSAWGNVTIEGTVDKEEGRTIFSEDSNGVCRYTPLSANPDAVAAQLESWMSVNI